MNDFVYYNPTKIDFGIDKEKEIVKYLKEASIKRILLVYGQDSIKKSGLYDEITTLLSENNIEFVELGGIKSNPILSKVNEGIDKVRDSYIQAIVAVGGGSVIDSAKAIACGVPYSGDVWDFFIKQSNIKEALSLYTIVTLAASASEMNGNCVITNEKTKQKYSISSPFLYPVVSMVNPQLMMSITNEYLAYSAVDIIAHAIEYYFSATTQPNFNSSIVESIIKNVILTTRQLLKNPNDYSARAEFAWISSWALNGLLSAGTKEGIFPNHMIEHSLSALYDIPHGAGLSIVIPAWMKWHKNQNIKQYQRFAKEVFALGTVDEGIEALENFFKEIGSPTTLYEVNISINDIGNIAKNAYELAKIWRMGDIYWVEKIVEILHLCKPLQ